MRTAIGYCSGFPLEAGSRQDGYQSEQCAAHRIERDPALAAAAAPLAYAGRPAARGLGRRSRAHAQRCTGAHGAGGARGPAMALPRSREIIEHEVNIRTVAEAYRTAFSRSCA